MQGVGGGGGGGGGGGWGGGGGGSLNAVDSMQHGKMHPDGTQCIPCSVAKWIPIECSGFHAAWPNGSRENAVDSMQCGAMDFD